MTGPNLTANAWTLEIINGRSVRVETAVEIVARKMWHRGNLATARDLFDLALITRSSPAALRVESRWLMRHRHAFLAQLVDRRHVLQAQFEVIDTLKPMPDFGDRVKEAQAFFSGLPR